jgi:hypothetical protein
MTSLRNLAIGTLQRHRNIATAMRRNAPRRHPALPLLGITSPRNRHAALAEAWLPRPAIWLARRYHGCLLGSSFNCRLRHVGRSPDAEVGGGHSADSGKRAGQY